MQRVRTQRFAEDISRGLDLIPSPLLERIGPVQWWEGDLGFAGHWHTSTPEYASAFSPQHFRWHGRNADRCCSTVAFIGAPRHRHLDHYGVIHELGHCLQFTLGSYGWEWGWPRYNLIGLPDLPEITDYKSDVYAEQFCEAMVAWLAPEARLPGRYRDAPARLWEGGRDWLALLNDLAGWPADRLPVSLQV